MGNHVCQLRPIIWCSVKLAAPSQCGQMRALVHLALAAKTQEVEGNKETEVLICGVTLILRWVEFVHSRPNMKAGFSAGTVQAV